MVHSINRVIITVSRKIFKYLPLPDIVINKLQALYLTRIYTFNKNKAISSGLYGDRRQNIISNYKPISERKEIIDIFTSVDVVNEKGSINKPKLSKSNGGKEVPDIRIYSTYTEYVNSENNRKEIKRIRDEFEDNLYNSDGVPFKLSGYCSTCQAERKFDVDFEYAYERNNRGGLIPNWRESLVCENCKMNNRIRASVDLLYNRLAVSGDDKIYATEQLTSFYSWLEYHYPNAVGSEYLGIDKSGGNYYSHLRHEDITQLSFDDNSLDVILSFDVIEHVPDIEKSLTEFIRCLKPGGIALITAPFVSNQYETIVRAKIGKDGKTEHLLEPEYHGNPTNPAMGSLCYYHFGWQLLDQLRSAGASATAVLSYYSSERMNIGNDQLFFVALK